MKYGIIGAGRIAPAYLKLARAFPGITPVAITDHDPENARRMAQEWGLEALSTEAMLARADIDTVINLTPIPVHFAVSKAILEAGKHLYSEKPLTGSLADSQALLDLAAERGLMIASAPDTFLGPAAQTARRLVDAGDIGEPVAASATFIMDGARFSRRFFSGEIGPLRELGPYYLTALVHLLGPVAQIVGLGRNIVARRAFDGVEAPIETPSDFRTLLHFETGVVADLTVSVDAIRTGRAPIEIQGTRGSLLLPDPNFFGGEVILLGRDGEEEVFSTAALAMGQHNWEEDRLANYRSVGLAEMADALAAGRAPRASGEMALHVAEIITLLLTTPADMSVQRVRSRFQRPAPLSDEQARNLMDQGTLQ